MMAEPGFAPLRVMEVDLDRPLPQLAGRDLQTGKEYMRGHLLVRLHGQPIGVVELDLPAQPAIYAPLIWHALGDAIRAHLGADGLPSVAGLPPGGLPALSEPTCRRERRAFKERAPFASVVVCTRDRPQSLRHCLDSLMSLDYPGFEVIVVDNAPSDTVTCRLIAENFCDRVRYIREDRPGLSWARNCGWRKARGEIVAFTDDDVVAPPGWLTELALGFEAAPDVACVTGIVLPAELETQAQLWFEQFGGVSKAHGFSRVIFGHSDRATQGALFPYLASQFGAGANMAFRVDELSRSGGFSTALGTGTPTRGGEDFEMFFRLIEAQKRLVYAPQAVLRHFHRRDETVLRRHLFSCGVAFTAYLTSCMVSRPARLFDLGLRIPRGVAYWLDPRSSRNQRKDSGFPAAFGAIEGLGMLTGPLAYVRSLRHSRRIAKRFAQAGVPGGER